MKRAMQLLAVCVAATTSLTGFALMVVGSWWGFALSAGASVALVLVLRGRRVVWRSYDEAPAEAARQDAVDASHLRNVAELWGPPYIDHPLSPRDGRGL